MSNRKPTPEVNEEDAFHFIVRALRDGSLRTPVGGSNFGYEVYLPNVIRHFLISAAGFQPGEIMQEDCLISPAFFAAAWELCRRGILRPGVSRLGQQSTEVGASGSGFSVTPTGHKWLREAGQYDFVPIEPGRFARQLETFATRFGPGFQERSQEAIRCYGANAYLACCSMCGAAAESILLAIAIAKDGDAEKIERLYLSSGGRGRVEKLILGQKPKAVQEEFLGYVSLLKYWRDNASHGKQAKIGDNEAYTALAVLLRFAFFAEDRWNELAA